MVRIIRRDEWGARPARSRAKIALPTSKVFIHHFATDAWHGPAGMRACQDFHMDRRGWADIAYSFCVDTDGTVFEARGSGIAGAHTRGHNSSSHAIACMANHQTTEPNSAQLEAMSALLRYGKEQGWWTLDSVAGHRDVGSTSCPGDKMHPLIGAVVQAAREVPPPPLRTMAQAVITRGTVDRLGGEVLAKAYGWAHVQRQDAQTFLRYDTGETVHVGFGMLVGGGQSADGLDGHIELAGPDRYQTAAAVGSFIRSLPPGTENRRGDPRV